MVTERLRAKCRLATELGLLPLKGRKPLRPPGHPMGRRSGCGTGIALPADDASVETAAVQCWAFPRVVHAELVPGMGVVVLAVDPLQVGDGRQRPLAMQAGPPSSPSWPGFPRASA